MLYITFQTDDTAEALSILNHINKPIPTMDDIRNVSGYAQIHPRSAMDRPLAEIPLTPTAVEKVKRMKRQGMYLGRLRHLPPKAKALVKKVYGSKGVDAAIKLANSFRDKPLPMVTNGGKHRAKCHFCMRGFLAKRRDSKHCSKRCRDAAYREKVR